MLNILKYKTNELFDGNRMHDIPVTLDSFNTPVSYEFFKNVIVTCSKLLPSRVTYRYGSFILETMFSRMTIDLSKVKSCKRESKKITLSTVNHGTIHLYTDNITISMAVCKIITGFMNGNIGCKQRMMESFHIFKGGFSK